MSSPRVYFRQLLRRLSLVGRRCKFEHGALRSEASTGSQCNLYSWKAVRVSELERLTGVYWDHPSLWLSQAKLLVMDNDEVAKGDKLMLSGLTFYGFHGVKPEERTLGQRFVVDVDAWTDLRAAGISDNVSDTVDYTEIYSIVKEVVEGAPHNLLESIAHHIAAKTFAKLPGISAIRVKVRKPHVPVHGQMDSLGVEIFRTRATHGQS